MLLLKDEDECSSPEGEFLCDANAVCSNMEGSFECVCNSGWNGNGETCSGEGMVRW